MTLIAAPPSPHVSSYTVVIVIGVSVGLAMVCGVVWYLYRRAKNVTPESDDESTGLTDHNKLIIK